jgi:hypothetical protein
MKRPVFLLSCSLLLVDCWQLHPRRLSLARPLRGSAADRAAAPGDDDSSFMASLRQRMDAVKNRESLLPVVVLDTMLPMQVMRIESGDPVFVKLIQQLRSVEIDGSTFAMVGVYAPNREAGDMRAVPMANGVEVEIVGTPEIVEVGKGGGGKRAAGGGAKGSSGSSGGGDGGGGGGGGNRRVRVSLRGGRRLRIAGQVQTSEEGWTEARVEFVDGSASSDSAGTSGGGSGADSEGSGGEEASSGGGDGYDEREENGRAPMEFALAMAAAEEFTSSGRTVDAAAISGGSSSRSGSSSGSSNSNSGSGSDDDQDEDEGKSLVERWVELARLRERSPRQIDTLLEDLGCDLELGRRTSFAEMVEAAMPPASRPSGRALWVGALINPLPG